MVTFDLCHGALSCFNNMSQGKWLNVSRPFDPMLAEDFDVLLAIHVAVEEH